MNDAQAHSSDVVNVSTYLTKMAQLEPYKRAVVYPAGRDSNQRVTYSHLTFLQLEHEVDRLAFGFGADRRRQAPGFYLRGSLKPAWCPWWWIPAWGSDEC